MLSVLGKIDDTHFNVYSSDSKMFDVMSEEELKEYIKGVGRVDGARLSWGRLKVDFRNVYVTYDKDKCFYCEDYKYYTLTNKSMDSELYMSNKAKAVEAVEHYIKKYRTYEQLEKACNGSVDLGACTLRCEGGKVIFVTVG